MKQVTREEVQQMVADGAQLVEVLPRPEYEHVHIKGARSLPLKEMNRQSVQQLDRGRPVITYCYDYQ